MLDGRGFCHTVGVNGLLTAADDELKNYADNEEHAFSQHHVSRKFRTRTVLGNVRHKTGAASVQNVLSGDLQRKLLFYPVAALLQIPVYVPARRICITFTAI